MPKYACLNPIAQCGLERFPDNYEKTEDLADADVALVRSAAMHDLELPESLVAIARAGAGVNNIPLEKCAKKGIVVFNAPGANANGVKEIVIAGMLLSCRDITGGIDWVKANCDDEDIAKTTEKAKKQFGGTEIKGKKLGVIGLGAVGVLVANAAVELGMMVYGFDPYLSVNSAWNVSTQVKHVLSTDEIYNECDFITIHVPLSESTKQMIGEKEIAMMKEDAVVLNFARDGLVDEVAMTEALKAGKIRRYVVDFPTSTTAGAQGCIVIPHLGASTEESEDNCAIMAVNELVDYVENGNIINSVNYPNCNLGPCKGESRVAIFHMNVKNTISQYTAVCGDAGINISDMTDKSQGDYAYCLLDLDAPVTDEIIEKLSAIEGVIRVRLIK